MTQNPLPTPPPPFIAENKTKIIVIVGVIIAVLLIGIVAATQLPGITSPSPTPMPTSNPEPTITPDFSLQTTGGSSGTVIQGKSVETTIFVQWLTGAAPAVTLSADSGSSGIQCHFNPSSKVPDYQSTLTMSVPTTTPINAYSVTITATNGAVTRSTSYTISVLSAKVYVSGTVTTTGTGTNPTQIQFVDKQTGVTYTDDISNNYYSVSLENEHSYAVTVSWEGLLYSTGTYDGGNLYVYAPVGYTSQNADFSG
jgi:hypothetical protein